MSTKRITTDPVCIDIGLVDGGLPLPRFFAQWEREVDEEGNSWSVDFKLWEALYWIGGKPEFPVKRGGTCAGDPTSVNILECEPMLNGFRKWDGCTHWWWPEYMHLDRPEETELFFKALRFVQKGAAEHLGGKWQGGEP